MPIALPYEVIQAIEKTLGKETAQRVIPALEKSLEAVKEELKDEVKDLAKELAKEERAIVKAELKDELTKELVTKADLLTTKAELKAEMDQLKAEINQLEVKFDGELKLIRFWLKILTALVSASLLSQLPQLAKVWQALLGAFK